MSYEVSTPVFEGPFDLLLHLITRDQVDIYEIRLCEIVDAYLAELDHLRDLDLEVATEFLLIAATLVELKLRRLLPGRDAIELDEELALLEERDLLLAKLLECQTFKGAAAALSVLSGRAARSVPRRGGLEEPFASLVPDLLDGVTADRLRHAYLAVLARAAVAAEPPRVDLSHVGSVKASVADAIEELVDELPRVGAVSFRHLTGRFHERIEVIVRFLAVLELYKQGWVELEQADNFGELRVVWRPDGADEALSADLAPDGVLLDVRDRAATVALGLHGDDGDEGDVEAYHDAALAVAHRIAAGIDSYDG